MAGFVGFDQIVREKSCFIEVRAVIVAQQQSTPHDQEVMGLNPAGAWMFPPFYPYRNVSLNRPHEEAQHY